MKNQLIKYNLFPTNVQNTYFTEFNQKIFSIIKHGKKQSKALLMYEINEVKGVVSDYYRTVMK